MQNNRQPPYDEESMEGQARHIVRNIPMLPVMHDPAYEEFGIHSQESVVSELSFSSDSPDSDSTVMDARIDGEPIVELPSTPPRQSVEVKTRFRSLDRTLTPETIGEALEKSGTVLMQRSRENRLAKQLEEMQTLMENDDELVVLKQPSTVRQIHSQAAFTQEVMRSFLEHSETMFQLVHDTQGGSSVRDVIGTKETTEEAQPKGTEAGHQPDTPPIQKVGKTVADEFVGCFVKNNDMVLYKRTIEAPPEEGQRRESIDTLIAQHAQCLVEADEVTQPSVQVYQTNDENLLALLTFSEQSSAMLKTSNATVDDVNSYEDLNRVLLQTYRQLLDRPDEMISMQTQRTKAESERPHTHQPRPDLLRSRSAGTASFGLSNDSRNGVTLQGSSKNWIECPKARNAAEIVKNLRLMLEEVILREIPATASVLKFFSRLLTDVLECAHAEVDEEFRRASLTDKIKRVLDELLMPHELEDPLRMVNQAKLTVDQIFDHQIQTRTIYDDADAWANILATSQRLVCELDHEIEDPDAFIEALQYGLRSILGSEGSKKLMEFEGQFETSTNTHSMCGESNEDAPALPTTVCHCFTSWVLFVLGASTIWLKELLINFWNFIITTPPILAGPSVSFRETVTDDDSVVQELRVQHDYHNQTLDVLRIVLEKSPSTAKHTQDDKPASSVNVRSLELFARLLQRAGSIELRHSDSHHNIHLQLRDGVSGDLQKRQSDDLVMLTGNIRDHEGNVAVCFDAHMYELNTVTQDEPAVEYVIRTERLSDDQDDDGEDYDAANEEEMVVHSVVEDILSADILEERQDRQSIVDALSEKINHYLQDLLEPVTSAVRDIQERMAYIGAEPLQSREVKLSDSPRKSVKAEDGSSFEHIDGKGSAEVDSSSSICKDRSMAYFSLAESLQELVSMFHDANDRLEVINCDVTSIRSLQLQLLQQQQQEKKLSKTSHGDGHCMKRRSSKKPPHSQRKMSSEVEKDLRNCTLCCPIKQQFLFAPTNQYSPVEVYSCHGVAPDVLVVHWTVDGDVLDCISGFEIHVDGVLRSVCFSNKRRTALVANINLRQQHELTLHATPDSHCKDSVRWAPAFFLYHL
uniref:Uncharacterized protein n=1 Tax=Anopheles atroparvus TaxID=41427 RepID=A0A8W7NFY4_ANOAO